MAEFGTMVWTAVQPYLATLVAGLVIWAAGLGIAYLKARVAAMDQDAFRAVLTMLVQAAEQKYNAGAGAAKFAWVAAELERRGYEVDEALLEAEVYWLSKFKKTTPAPCAPDVAGQPAGGE